MRTIISSLGGILIAGSLLAGCSGQSADAQQSGPSSTASASNAVPDSGQSTSTTSTTSTQAPSAADNGDGARRLARDYKQQCGSAQKLSEECQSLRALLVAEVSTALELMATSKDQRMVPQALAALEFPDEPTLIIAACRILAQFPDAPGLVDKVMPLLLRSRFIDVQRAAAGLLASIPDVAAVEAGQLWLHNHDKLITGGPYDDYPDFPKEFAAMGFPKYPGAQWFSPGDADRAVGFSTTDDAATVTRWFAQALKAEPMDANQWSRQLVEQTMAVTQNADPSGAMQKLQALMQRGFSGDASAAKELETIQQDIEKASKAQQQGMNNIVGTVMPADSGAAQAHWIVGRSKNKRFSTVVIVYPLASLRRTVIQLVWDLSDYPSAWPAPPEMM